MKVTIKRIWKSISRVNGNSLAEFATVSALMATLAATAAPKLSEVSEGTKAQKSMNEIDKLLTQAKNFYQDTADLEGRGRFPGQDKYDYNVGGYGTDPTHTASGSQYTEADRKAQESIINDVLNPDYAGSNVGGNDYTAINKYTHADLADWRTVFGKADEDSYNGGKILDEMLAVDDQGGTCATCPGTSKGDAEWTTLMGGSAMASPFQDGFFCYVVVAGGGSGKTAFPPTLYIVDAENPTHYNALLTP